jgi:hypothetical protein
LLNFLPWENPANLVFFESQCNLCLVASLLSQNAKWWVELYKQ